jgi:predicted GNAT superfamily acetyltransferase
MAISVRPATPSDLEFVSQDGHAPRAAVRRKIDHGEVFVVEVGGEPAGHLRLEFLWSVQPYVALIHVVERHRGRGAGRALLEHVERDLRNEGHAVLFSSSQVDEPEPQAWHRHMGFEECGVIAGLNEGGVGELFFRKVL